MLVSMAQMLSAQIGYRHNVVPSALPDSVDLAYYGKKRFGRSATTVVGVNLGVWAFDRYVRNQDYAYILSVPTASAPSTQAQTKDLSS